LLLVTQWLPSWLFPPSPWPSLGGGLNLVDQTSRAFTLEAFPGQSAINRVAGPGSFPLTTKYGYAFSGAVGYGDTHPWVPTGPGVREPQNRRVEIILK
jgi:hypothetical protein